MSGAKTWAPWSQFQKTLKGHPNYRGPQGMDCSLCCICIIAQLLPLPSPASLAPNLPINPLHVNLHLRICFREPDLEADRQ